LGLRDEHWLLLSFGQNLFFVGECGGGGCLFGIVVNICDFAEETCTWYSSLKRAHHFQMLCLFVTSKFSNYIEPRQLWIYKSNANGNL
jgi:hypothetical protein